MLTHTESIHYEYQVDETLVTEKEKEMIRHFTVTFATMSFLKEGTICGKVHYFITDGPLKGTHAPGAWQIRSYDL